MTLRVLAVADSESFLKWAATTLERLALDGTGVHGDVTLVKGPLEPSPAQVRAALAGTRMTSAPVVSRQRLARIVKDEQPDAVLVAATGPVAEMIALTVLRAAGDRRAVLLSGPPGVAMSPAATTGVRWRYRWCDAYIVHSPREADLFTTAFERYGSAPRIVLTRLPFLAEPPTTRPQAPVRRVVFAPQSIVPHTRSERVALLRGLARLHDDGFEVVVKVRTSAGEQQTHHEALPFETLWRQEHGRLGHARDALRFEAGSMSDWLSPGTALVTVSSTAALESLSLGLPTVVLPDFGVTPDLGNAVYEGSGCIVPLRELGTVLRAGGPVPDPDWLAANYLHDAAESVTETIRDLLPAVGGPATPRGFVRPVSRAIAVYSALKSDLPLLWYPAKWGRALIGRFVRLH
ncbi:hypothetical protein DNL40_05385 [Xylanimonas oleitrophica]|uniref:UDP-N-acetylglucosamine:LPS N-acetylglucosamine transferase n=1 Tax=Xylanimonas oleitrophica TaxID=2607479 RepID=A0A2W5WUN3_9MICO|nr:DUF6716 putative glycosyltransferase [Xylanimonas oleitrophica]PZR54333.1 hypothetical protein DNL40_05385 [Xylanimonas oleitrophica]